MKLELLTNATIVDDAIRFVTSNANSSNINGIRIHALDQEQRQEKAVKPKTHASFLDSTQKDSDIQGPQEETECLPEDATTINSVF